MNQPEEICKPALSTVCCVTVQSSVVTVELHFRRLMGRLSHISAEKARNMFASALFAHT